MKKGIQELHRRFVLAPADKAANNVVVVWKRYYINTLKQELSTAKTYEHNRLDETSIVDRHQCHMAAKFGLFVDEDHSKLPTLYWLPKRHKRSYKSRFIANSSACTTTELSILLTSCLTAIKNHVIKYCTTVDERNGKNLFWSIKNSGEILNKLKSRGFLASALSTNDFSTLYTTLPHNLIKEKLTELIEQTFNREGSLYLACNDKNAFFTSEQPKRYKLWSWQKMCDALHYPLDNIFIRFGSKLYRHIVGTNCAPLVADSFLFCYERDLCCLCQTIIKLILLKCLVLVQPMKTRPFITERLLMERKESNQTKNKLLKLLTLPPDI